MSGCALVVGTLLSYCGMKWFDYHQTEIARVALSADIQMSEPSWTEASVPDLESITKTKTDVLLLKPLAAKPAAKPVASKQPTPQSSAVVAKTDTSKTTPASTARIWEHAAPPPSDAKVVVKTVEVAKSSVDFKLVDLPTSTTAMIQVGSLVRPVKVGEKLPSGEVIQSIDVDAKNITLSSGKKVKLP